MTGLKCPECGCPVPPDATRCPNCSYKYDQITAKVLAKSNGKGITVSCVGYATKCSVLDALQDLHYGQRPRITPNP